MKGITLVLLVGLVVLIVFVIAPRAGSISRYDQVGASQGRTGSFGQTKACAFLGGYLGGINAPPDGIVKTNGVCASYHNVCGIGSTGSEVQNLVNTYKNDYTSIENAIRQDLISVSEDKANCPAPTKCSTDAHCPFSPCSEQFCLRYHCQSGYCS